MHHQKRHGFWNCNRWLKSVGSLPLTVLEIGSTLVNSQVHDTGASPRSQKQAGSAGLTGIKGIQQLGGFGQKNKKRHEKVAVIIQSIPNQDCDSWKGDFSSPTLLALPPRCPCSTNEMASCMWYRTGEKTLFETSKVSYFSPSSHNSKYELLFTFITSSALLSENSAKHSRLPGCQRLSPRTAVEVACLKPMSLNILPWVCRDGAAVIIPGSDHSCLHLWQHDIWGN